MNADVDLLLRLITLTKQLEMLSKLDPNNKTWKVQLEVAVTSTNGQDIKVTEIEDDGGLETVIELFENKIVELNEKDKVS